MSRKHIPRRIYLQISKRHLCPQLFSEEVEVRNCHSTAGARFDPEALESRRKRLWREGSEMKKTKVTEGSGNVFADIGLLDADQVFAKAELASLINRTIRERAYTQHEAAKILGVDQPRISALQRGKLTLFSFSKLAQFIVRLGNQIEMTIKPLPTSTGRDNTFSVLPLIRPDFILGNMARSTTVSCETTIDGIFHSQQGVSVSMLPGIIYLDPEPKTAGVTADVKTLLPGTITYARDKELHI